MPGFKVRFGTPPNGFVAMLDVGGEYKPGDPPPDGYCDWHEWADVQAKAGLKYKGVVCKACFAKLNESVK